MTQIKPGIDYRIIPNVKNRVEEQVIAWAVAGKSGSDYRVAHVPDGRWELLAIAGCTDRCVPLSMRPHLVQMIKIADGETKPLDLRLRQPQR